MSWREVDPPPALPARAAGLGALDPALGRWAALQGDWPPRVPTRVRHLPPDQAWAGAAADLLAAGAALADAAADEAVELLVVDPVGPDGPALAVLAAWHDLEPVATVGTAGGPGWAEALVGVREALPLARRHLADPEELLDALDDPVLTTTTGLLAQAAVRRTPVLLGSAVTAAAAAVLADRLALGTARWLLAGCSPAAPGAQRALRDLGLVPLLDLRLPVAGGGRLAEAVLVGALDLLDARG